jgi:hypothetical protein
MKALLTALLAVITATLMISPVPAQAQLNMGEPDPAVWLRQVYDLYQRAEKDKGLEKQATYRIVVKRASKSLAALFKKNDACEVKWKGVCALDWDFIVDGQDNQLTNIKVDDAAISGDKATVTVTFKNFDTPCKNTFHFAREGGVWKVDEIETQHGTDAPIWIGKTLREYKPGG